MLGFGALGEFALGEWEDDVSAAVLADRIVYVAAETRFTNISSEDRIVHVVDD